MTYIVNDNCIKCKLMDCMEVCPVDCFYEGECESYFKEQHGFSVCEACIIEKFKK